MRQAEEILEGTYVPPMDQLEEVHQWIKDLAHTRQTRRRRPVKTRISGEQWAGPFKKIQERTASSLSNRHIGHYKAALEDADLTNLHAEMTLLPFIHGFAPDRWIRLIDAMLKKDPGLPKLHRLWIIVLLEADMNMGFKILYNYRMIPHAEKLNLIPREHFGNQKGVQALHCVRIKVLLLDMMRVTREVKAVEINDAAECYDRIIPACSSLVNRRGGLCKAVMTANCEVMRNMRRHIRTAHGISEESYGDSDDCRQYGEGQGKGSSPQLGC